LSFPKVTPERRWADLEAESRLLDGEECFRHFRSTE